MTLTDLLEKKCLPEVPALPPAEVTSLLALLDNWHLADGKIVRAFDCKNYYDTLSFINAIAYVIHAENHHPELVVTYNRCVVKFDTHSVNDGRGGLSINDFVCAAKIDTIFQQSFS
ncbi:4a-hydroxytetrahydrobiopterin dehydratase [Actimicrobium sp. CCI2.3]|uniref:4a-hydroxytetrahydrobiopterin dehydratase n=1 Tax=Actimicrobium sp. CCI2.3 TaxID=3048616 RepID=UPI002AB5C8BE|nr:4a-hydroxytetrahydrobiopterin dehydratase [Actimicrobium sp. CCI2.3]MDY7575830.1 4a-hydroxytetrahydrobiopterin dehydratase [Actimicrobium sp. CCI2.3]MEB0021643.1 4a-hydroxytetrahydrobiopterin dehydratase [Actimicrobium sp. CCI2.3]